MHGRQELGAPDFSRQDIKFAAAMAFLVGAIAGGCAADLAIGIAGTTSAFTGIVGALIGGAIAFLSITYHNHRNRQLELVALKASIYAEIADRAARCINDYLKPWRSWGDRKLTREDLIKFRPTDPVVLPGVSGKLGLLQPTTLLAVTQFYFRLAALSDAFVTFAALYERREARGEPPARHPNHKEQVDMIEERLRSCFDPALRSLESLNVRGATDYDDAACLVYPHLLATGDTLRDALRRNRPA